MCSVYYITCHGSFATTGKRASYGPIYRSPQSKLGPSVGHIRDHHRSMHVPERPCCCRSNGSPRSLASAQRCEARTVVGAMGKITTPRWTGTDIDDATDANDSVAGVFWSAPRVRGDGREILRAVRHGLFYGWFLECNIGVIGIHVCIACSHAHANLMAFIARIWFKTDGVCIRFLP